MDGVFKVFNLLIVILMEVQKCYLPFHFDDS